MTLRKHNPNTRRRYLSHHSGSNITLKEAAAAYLKNLRGAEDYRAEMKRTVDNLVDELGKTTVFHTLNKAKLIGHIKSGETYWTRYSRTRAVSVLITQAREVEAIKLNPLDDGKFEDATKATPHFLKQWEVEAKKLRTK